MWDWMFRELKKIEKKIVVKGIDKEDVIQNVCLYLCQNPQVSKDIYSNKNIGMLYILVRHEIYDVRSKIKFKNRVELSLYRKIISVCEKYNIEPCQNNAYKILPLLDNKWKEFSIGRIVYLLSQ